MHRIIVETALLITPHGIRIKDWRIDTGDQELRCNLWDFGGQDIMHATHQFFLSRRSLYVLVLDGRKDERPANTGCNILKASVAIHRCWWCSISTTPIPALTLIGLSSRRNTPSSKAFGGLHAALGSL
jgi:hypothetical protein